MKRFYKSVTVIDGEGGFAIELDGRPVRTAGKRALVTPTGALADAIAEEWQAQADEIVPAQMPLTQIANTALDHVGPNRAEVVEVTAAYGRSDLLCYRADAPTELVDRQSAAWDSVLAWFAENHGAPLLTTSGIVHRSQPDASISIMDNLVTSHDDWRLAGLSLATARLGSLVLAIGLTSGKFDVAEAMALAHIDEDYQIERWGQDDEALARRASIAEDVTSARRLIDLLNS
ncbi:MAG: ATP12 family protein [Pseudomonadota bacterium]